MRVRALRYKVWHLGDRTVSPTDADTLTEALNAYLAQGWVIAAAANTYMVLAQYPPPGKPGRKSKGAQ